MIEETLEELVKQLIDKEIAQKISELKKLRVYKTQPYLTRST